MQKLTLLHLYRNLLAKKAYRILLRSNANFITIIYGIIISGVSTPSIIRNLLAEKAYRILLRSNANFIHKNIWYNNFEC